MCNKYDIALNKMQFYYNIDCHHGAAIVPSYGTIV